MRQEFREGVVGAQPVAKSQNETRGTQRRYDRLAGVYDIMERFAERGLYGDWRQSLWQRVTGDRILEVGTGTGMNVPYYPPGVEVHAIDISQPMLARAAQRVGPPGTEIHLHQMDAQSMQFADNTFDAAVATFVFCSIPDAVTGLREIRRVVRPGGRVHLLEHGRSAVEWVARLMDLCDPFALRLLGPHINRRTVENVSDAGLAITEVQELGSLGVFKRIEARVAG